jgi:hypothetical protein
MRKLRNSTIGIVTLAIVLMGSMQTTFAGDHHEGWIKLMDGKTFKGWKITEENPDTFQIVDGAFVAKGPRAHLFYNGSVKNHDFKNFELKVTVKTLKKSNGGIYIHTKFEKSGWPSKGYEIQVNNSHSDWRRTASVYAIKDVREKLKNDGEWYTYHIIVKGKKITVKLDGKTVNEYTEPENAERPNGMKDRLLNSGTFGLQGHDPGSTIYYKDIMVKPLAD